MAHQASGQLDFADSFLGNNQKLNQRLDKVQRLVDWKPFEERLARISHMFQENLNDLSRRLS